MFAGRVSGNCLAGLLINRKDDASIKRNDRPQLVRYECDGVVQIQRRANSLRDLMQRLLQRDARVSGHRPARCLLARPADDFMAEVSQASQEDYSLR